MDEKRKLDAPLSVNQGPKGRLLPRLASHFDASLAARRTSVRAADETLISGY